MKAHTLLPILMLAGISPVPAGNADPLIASAAAHEQKGETRAALQDYLAADKAQPNVAAILVKIAKQYGDLMTEIKDEGERKRAGEQSLVYSRKALKAEPDNPEANLSVAISTGKLAEFMGNREKIEASREIKRYADRALALDPESDYAHHMLGRWHQELAGMGMATRTLAKIVYGGIPAASYQEALDHFARAKELRKDRLIHRIEYGRTLAMLGRKEEAKKELAKCLAEPSRDKDDEKAKERARGTLGDL